MTTNKQPQTKSLRRRAEERLAAGPPQTPAGISLDEAKLLLHELQVHQMELELQNEELQRAQAELVASQERYRELYELAPVGYLSVSKKGSILTANLCAANLLSLAKNHLLRQPLSRFIVKDDLDDFYLRHKRLFETGEPQSCELRMVKPDGTLFWAALQANVAPDGDYEAPAACRIVLSDITARMALEDQAARALQEKTVLLQELHHRVKNNLMVVCSLLSLQAQKISDPASLDLFAESRNRIMSMALIHEKLYQAHDLASVNFKEYLQELVHYILESHKPAQVAVLVEMEDLSLDVNQGVPCGLIVNELVTNCLIHAFPAGRTGEVRLGISRTGSGDNLLIVEDNGIGLPPELDIFAPSSLGLELVKGLTAQIHGRVEFSRKDGQGTKISIRFPGVQQGRSISA